MKSTIALLAILISASTTHAVTLSFTAQAGTGVADLTGTPLSGTDVQIGYYNAGSFNLLGDPAGAESGAPLPAGLFGGSALFESASLAALQPAMRIFSSDGGSVVAYSTSWAFVAGDGTGTDFSTQSIDLASVAIGGALTGTGVIIAEPGSTFNINGAVNPTFGSPSLEIGLVPEPSSYAAIAGFLALGFVMIRRRS